MDSRMSTATGVRSSIIKSSKSHKKSDLYYWSLFTYRYPQLVVVSLIVAFILCRYYFHYFSSYLLAGSYLSLVAEFFVVLSYINLKNWRRHPSQMLFYRTLANVGLTIVTIANATRASNSSSDLDSADCRTISFFTQFSFFAGECWLFMISTDLIISLTNPFTSIKKNVQKYIFWVLLLSFLSATVLVSSSSCQGVMADHVCWMDVGHNGSTCFWGFVLSWSLLYYIYSACAIAYAFTRISRGLELTFESRKDTLLKHVIVLFTYFIYAIILVVLYITMIISEHHESDKDNGADSVTTTTLKYVLALFLGCRGVVDSLLWFRMHRSTLPNYRYECCGIEKKKTKSSYTGDSVIGHFWKRLIDPFNTLIMQKPLLSPDETINANNNFNSQHHSGIDVNASADADARSEVTSTHQSITRMPSYRSARGVEVTDRGSNANNWDRGSIAATHDEDGLDEHKSEDWLGDMGLNPQLNLALRKEVLYFVTQGILKSLEKAEELAAAVSQGYNSDSGRRVNSLFNSLHALSDLTKGIQGEEMAYISHDYSFTLDNFHSFKDRMPLLFRRLRELAGISEPWYAQQIAVPTQEKLAEGASGAFMFFCGAGEYMVKTISATESETLISILKIYVAHLEQNPKSLLVRFLGLHELNMYNQTFYFVVMKNIFPSTAVINQRYDIKGSWINRSASGSMPPGTKTFCKHCGELFRIGTSGKCHQRVGTHEPNLILKDNDLTTKIRMKPDEAFQVIDVLNRDSDALCAMGITDYSLLLGIRNISYEVEPDVVSGKRSKSFAEFISAQGRGSVGLSLPPINENTQRSSSLSDLHKLGIDIDTFSAGDNNSTRGSLARPSYNQPLGPSNKQIHIDTDSAGTEGGYMARTVIAPGVYYFGIVDILQTWSFDKIIEREFKTRILNAPAEGISCMPPEPYKDRFQKKISDIIEHSSFIREVTGSWKGTRAVSGPMSLVPDV